jgi:hypothetical protein
VAADGDLLCRQSARGQWENRPKPHGLGDNGLREGRLLLISE